MRVGKGRVRDTHIDRPKSKLFIKLLSPPQFPWRQGSAGGGGKKEKKVLALPVPISFSLFSVNLDGNFLNLKAKNLVPFIFAVHLQGHFLKQSFSILEAYSYYLESFPKTKSNQSIWGVRPGFWECSGASGSGMIHKKAGNHCSRKHRPPGGLEGKKTSIKSSYCILSQNAEAQAQRGWETIFRLHS